MDKVALISHIKHLSDRSLIPLMDIENIGETKMDLNLNNIREMVKSINKECIFDYRLLILENESSLQFDKSFYGKLSFWKTKFISSITTNVSFWKDWSNF